MRAYVWTLLLAASYFWVTTSGASTDFSLCFEDHCYLRSDSQMSWTDAFYYCWKRDSLLSSVHSDEQNEYILVNVCMHKGCWIGLNYDEQERKYFWVDGTYFNYSNWNSGEPTEPTTFVQMRSGLWLGVSDGATIYASCMRPVPTSNPTRSPSAHPTEKPTSSPSTSPTFSPTEDPTTHPTVDPSKWPTSPPTADPTTQLTYDPSKLPTSSPTADPTIQPTFDPTKQPTLPPTVQSKSSVMSDQLIVVLVALTIMTILFSIVVCVICCWALPIVRRSPGKTELQDLESTM